MGKPWHVLRRIYMPVIFRKRRKDSERINRAAERLSAYYRDELSLDVLRLRERFNIDRFSGTYDHLSVFLDFLLKNGQQIHVENLDAESILILYEKTIYS